MAGQGRLSGQWPVMDSVETGKDTLLACLILHYSTVNYDR